MYLNCVYKEMQVVVRLSLMGKMKYLILKEGGMVYFLCILEFPLFNGLDLRN